MILKAIKSNTQKKINDRERKKGNKIMNNNKNNNKYNFNNEEIGEIKDYLEAINLDLAFINSYARIIEDKLEDIQTGHHLDKRKDIKTDATTILALEYQEAQRNIEHYINLSYSIDDKLKTSEDTIRKIYSILNKTDAETNIEDKKGNYEDK